jgi:hypothetical protein
VVSLTVTFNPQVLRVRAVQEGSFLRQGGVAVDLHAAGRWRSRAGRHLDDANRRRDGRVGRGPARGHPLRAGRRRPGASTLSIRGIATTPRAGAFRWPFSSVAVTVR